MTHDTTLEEIEEEINQLHKTIQDKMAMEQRYHSTAIQFYKHFAKYIDSRVNKPSISAARLSNEPVDDVQDVARFELQDDEPPYKSQGIDAFRLAVWHSEFDEVEINLYFGPHGEEDSFGIDVMVDNAVYHAHGANTLIGAIRAVEMSMFMIAHMAARGLRPANESKSPRENRA